MDEIQAKLDQIQAKLDQNKADQEALKEQRRKLVTELEASGVIPLKHGDCYCDGTSRVVIIEKGDAWIFSYYDGGFTEADEATLLHRIKQCGYFFTGVNIFDNFKTTR